MLRLCSHHRWAHVYVPNMDELTSWQLQLELGEPLEFVSGECSSNANIKQHVPPWWGWKRGLSSLSVSLRQLRPLSRSTSSQTSQKRSFRLLIRHWRWSTDYGQTWKYSDSFFHRLPLFLYSIRLLDCENMRIHPGYVLAVAYIFYCIQHILITTCQKKLRKKKETTLTDLDISL